MWVMNAFRFGVVSTPATITFLQCTQDDTDQTTYTFLTQNTGTASADRVTGLVIMVEDGASVLSVSSGTVGGDAITIAANQYGTGAGGYTGGVAVAAVANPADTSETVAITMSEAVTSMRICLFQMNNVSSVTATASTQAEAAGAVALDINTTADGVGMAGCANNNGSRTFTWAGFTERVDNPGGTPDFGSGAADFDEDGTASTPLTVNCTDDGAGTTGGAAAFYR
jgi:hypothetical protein